MWVGFWTDTSSSAGITFVSNNGFSIEIVLGAVPRFGKNPLVTIWTHSFSTGHAAFLTHEHRRSQRIKRWRLKFGIQTYKVSSLWGKANILHTHDGISATFCKQGWNSVAGCLLTRVINAKRPHIWHWCIQL
jgi:hypothetical protein